MMQPTADTLQVPMNKAGYQKYRHLNISLAVVGLSMVLLALAGCLYSPYAAVTDTKGRGDWLFIGSMCLWLVAFIGLATAPAWHLSVLQTKTLSRKLPALVIDQEGIEDNVSNYVLGRISWSEIQAVVLSSRYAPNIRKTFPGLAIVLKDKETLLRKKTKVVAMWMQVDPEIRDKGEIFIPQGRLEVPVADLVAQINAFRARAAQ